ncbi:MAG TPA: hypothetical protein VGG48_09725 [Rhizomicrobium sp.]|jgi:hypothetical protein
MKHLAIVLALSAVPSVAAADGDRLAPGTDLVDGYVPAVVDVLREAFGDGVQVNALVLPSFGNEYAVGTKVTHGQWFVFVTTAKAHIWVALLDKKPIAAIGEDVCEAPISASLGGGIGLVWQGMLRRKTADSEPPNGVDGTSWLFAGQVDGKLSIGMTWSPPPDSQRGKLVAIAESMAALCKGRTDAQRATLDGEVGELQRALQTAP